MTLPSHPVQVLGGVWSFAPAPLGSKTAPVSGWLKAQVPGNVHLDLMAAGRLKDPLAAGNEAAAAWVEHKEWWYRCRFKAAAGLASSPRLRLVAEGLDTWCTLWLNGARLGRTETMFVEHAFELGRRLRSGSNELLLRFEAPAVVLAALEKKHGYRSATGDQRRMHGRKAAYSFGWDWAPRLPTCGVFRPLRLEALPNPHVADFWVRTLFADALCARGEAWLEIESAGKVVAPVSVRVGEWGFDGVRRLRPGRNRFKFNWTLDRPRLWWPRGWGAPLLTPADARVAGGPTLRLDVGIRTVALDQRKDAEGKSFGFLVNGRPIFAKGANWIPADSFVGRVEAERVERLVGLAADANYNMLRVWGGGLFESEDFYRACDRLGLLVWQDFLFSCSEVPEDPAFKALVAAETATVLRRLRRHPSLALLCGNNENHMARHDGWFRGRESRRWGSSLYHGLLPKICARLAPGVPYWPGSPYGGDDPNSQAQGDRHHWLAWGQWKDPETYRSDRGRFISEFGLAALPNREALDLALGAGERWPQGRELALHDKDGSSNGGGLARLALFIFRHLPFAPGLDAFRYLSQVFQSQGLALGIEHWRRLKPHTQGTLVWQHNDCWPVVSWSLLDAVDAPKLAYFGVKRAFDDVLLSAVESAAFPKAGRPTPRAADSLCEVWLSLDGPAPRRGHLRVERWNMLRREAVLADMDCGAAAESSRRLWSRSRRACGVTDPAGQYLVATFESGDLYRRSLQFFERPVRLDFRPSQVVVGARAKGGLIEVAVHSKSLAMACEVAAPVPGAFSDNGFDLLPGETRVLTFKPAVPGGIRGPWGLKTLNQMAALARAAGS